MSETPGISSMNPLLKAKAIFNQNAAVVRKSMKVGVGMMGMLLILPASAQDVNQQSVSTSASQAGPPLRRQVRAQSTITFRDALLTVNILNQPLSWVAEEIISKTKVALVLANGLETRRVSLSFQNLSLEEGLRRLLKDEDAFYFYRAKQGAPSALSVVWAYPRGKGQGLAPTPPETWASTKEVEGMLSDPDPEVRSRAIESLIQREGPKARNAVLSLLKDPDNSVRIQALHHSAEAGVELPADYLSTLALSDASPDVRFLALENLGNNNPGAVEAIAEKARNDPDIRVQMKAQEILQELHSDSEEPVPVTATQPNEQ
jgi:hypothetical protein